MLLMLNVDDISGEVVPHAIDGLMERGAKSVHVVPALTKKGRPEFLFFVDAPETALDDLAAYLSSELGTLGVRVISHEHVAIPYRQVDVDLHWAGNGPDATLTVSAKRFEDERGNASRVKAESEDLRAALDVLAKGGVQLSFQSLKSLVEMVAQSGSQGSLGQVTARMADH